MGYYSHEELKKCEEASIRAYISKPIISKNTAQGLFGKEKFVYDARVETVMLPQSRAINLPL